MSESDELYNFLIHRRTIHSKKLIKKEHIKKEPNASNLSHKIKYREEKNIDPFNSILYLEFNKYLKKMGIPDNFFDLDVLGNCLRKIYYEKMGIKGKRISPFFMLEQYYGKNIFSHLNKLGIELEANFEDKNFFYIIIKTDNDTNDIKKEDLLFFKYKYDLILTLIHDKFKFEEMIFIFQENSKYIFEKMKINHEILSDFMPKLKELYIKNIPRLKTPKKFSEFSIECDSCKFNIICKKDRLKEIANNRKKETISKFIL